MYGNSVLGTRLFLGGAGATVMGGGASLPITGTFEVALWVVAAFTLLAAGLALLRLIPRREV